MTKKTAIILSGAISRGAWEVGVLKSITQTDLNIRNIVSTSAGSLNACLLAAGLTSNNLSLAMDELVAAWLNKGKWNSVLSFNLQSMASFKGLATHHKLHAILKAGVEKVLTTVARPIELKLVVTQLSGHTAMIGNKPNTSFENVIDFDQFDFLNQHRREDIYTAACASAAFPGLFAPVFVREYGWCLDGGLTNNCAVKHALQMPHIDRIIIITPTPPVSNSFDTYGGLNLVGRVGDIVANERLYRDLVEVEKINSMVKRITALKESEQLSLDQYHRIDNILNNKREIEIVEIRPKYKLRGNSFSGLFSRKLRMEYIQEGIKDGKAALELL